MRLIQRLYNKQKNGIISITKKENTDFLHEFSPAEMAEVRFNKNMNLVRIGNVKVLINEEE